MILCPRTPPILMVCSLLRYKLSHITMNTVVCSSNCYTIHLCTNNTPKMPPEGLAHQNKHRKLACMTILAAANATMSYASQFNKKLQHTSRLSGRQWVEELLAGHQKRFYNELGMQKYVFRRLLHVLKQKTGLSGMRHVSVAEQLAIFLHYACRGLSNRALQERFSIVGTRLPSAFCFILGIEHSNIISPLGVSIASLTC